ncbi:MAG: hypothetical protein HUU56_08830 [Bdellovibrionaceae bacterium]|nr:hypothetical protein [Pseudobdellovibrionaceae bacterium]
MSSKVLGNCDYFNFGDLQNFAENAKLSAQLVQFKKNPKDFCDQQMAIRYLRAPATNGEKKPSREQVDSALSANKIQDLTRKTYLENNILTQKYDNWNRTLIPIEDSRTDITKEISFNDPDNKDQETMDLDRALQLLSKRESCMEVYHADCYRNYEKKNPPFKTTKVQKGYACYEILGALKFFSCDKDLDTVSRIATPVSNVTGRDILMQVMEDARYNEGIRLAALKIASHTKRKVESDLNLFDDLKKSFIEAGASENDSEEMTWNTLAILSASGANLWQRFISVPYSYDQGQKRLSFYVIAASLPILDHKTSGSGHIYSFPKEISGSCNTGKSYHFWYTAFLARQATLENGNPETAMVSAFQSQKFYQINRGKIGNGNINNSINSDSMSPTSYVTRIDLAYSGAGALYGAQKATTQVPTKQNTDQVVEALIQSSGKGIPSVLVDLGAPMMDKPFSDYPSWFRKFNPNRALNKNSNFSGRVKKEYLEFKKTPNKVRCEKNQSYDC